MELDLGMFILGMGLVDWGFLVERVGLSVIWVEVMYVLYIVRGIFGLGCEEDE